MGFNFIRLNTTIPDGRAPLGEDESLSRSASDSSVSIPAGLNKYLKFGLYKFAHF